MYKVGVVSLVCFKLANDVNMVVSVPIHLRFFLFRYQTNVATQTMATMVSIQPKDSGGGGGETRESTVQRLADDMLSKLPPDYLPHEVKDRLKKMGHLSPMNIFLRQEIDRMQRVIISVRSTLIDLKLAIDGTIIMSEVRQ